MSYHYKSCDDCICRYCLMWWKGDGCPYGTCYDDYRARTDPYINHHPARYLWSRSHELGEQEHWCRGGSLYPSEECEHFIQYEGQKIEQCHRASVQVFQDGSRVCCMMVNGTCEKCLTDLEGKINGKYERRKVT